MVIRYSTCHFAQVMPVRNPASSFLAECSFCGKGCRLVPMEHRLEHDLELTLRRWKDGDCSLDGMFDRVNKELFRSWNEVFEAAATTLQSNGKPKYKYSIDNLSWQEADDPVSDLVVKSRKPTQTHTKSAQSDPKRKANT